MSPLPPATMAAQGHAAGARPAAGGATGARNATSSSQQQAWQAPTTSIPMSPASLSAPSSRDASPPPSRRSEHHAGGGGGGGAIRSARPPQPMVAPHSTVALAPFAAPATAAPAAAVASGSGVGASPARGQVHSARGRASRTTASAMGSPRIAARDPSAAASASAAASPPAAAIAAVAALVPPPPPSAGLSLRTRDARGALSGYSYTSRARSPRTSATATGPRPSLYNSGYPRSNLAAPPTAYYSDGGGSESGHLHLHPAALASYSAASLPHYASTSLAHFASHPITFATTPGTSPPHAHAHLHALTHAQDGHEHHPMRPASPAGGMQLPPLAHRPQSKDGGFHFPSSYPPAAVPAVTVVYHAPPPVPKQDRASQTSPTLSPMPTPTVAPVPLSAAPAQLLLHHSLMPHSATYSPALQRQLSTSPQHQPRRPGYDSTHARLHEFHSKPLDDKEEEGAGQGEEDSDSNPVPSLPSPSQSSSYLSDALMRFYSNLGDWDFDIFELHAVSNGWPLSMLFMLLDKRHGFLAATGVPLATAWHFIQEVESNYLPLPYHTATHAADVLHASYHLVEHTPMLREGLTPLNVFVLYISAAVHDIQHPGLNNAFLVNARTPLAMRYNDRSVLESFHISSAFRMMAANPQCNVLAHFPFATYSQIRKQLIDLVLSTDLAVHFELMSAFKRKIAMHTAALAAAAAAVPAPADETDGSIPVAAPAAAAPAAPAPAAGSAPAGLIDVVRVDEDRAMIMQIILKCGDLSHPARSRRLHLRWSEMVMEEFFLQGDRERQLNLPPSMFMDRETANLAQSQIGFITFLVYPMFQAYAAFAQKDYWARRVEENLEWWHEVARQEGEEKKAAERMAVGSASDAEGSNVEGETSEGGSGSSSSSNSRAISRGADPSASSSASSAGSSSSSGHASSASEPNSASLASSRRASIDSVLSTITSATPLPSSVSVAGEPKPGRRSISVMSTTISTSSSSTGDGMSPPHPETPLSAGGSAGPAGSAGAGGRKEVSFSVDVSDKSTTESTVPAAAVSAGGSTPNSAPVGTGVTLQRRSSEVSGGTSDTPSRSRLSHQRRSNTESSLTATMAMLTETAQAAALSAAGASVDEAQEQQVEDAVAAQAQVQATAAGVSPAVATPKLPHLQLSLSSNKRMSAMRGVGPPASPLVLAQSLAHKAAAVAAPHQSSPVLTHGNSSRSTACSKRSSLATTVHSRSHPHLPPPSDPMDALQALPLSVLGPGLSVDVRSDTQSTLCNEVHLLASPTHDHETEDASTLASSPTLAPADGAIPAFSKTAHAMLDADTPTRPPAN